ncbi:hypothetical protein [Nocardia wallacei]|uniref:hypothetical protein n=1 Tax=Nocardia wallacei TaxID=480035 RepID=UPI0024568D9C|nr:hypothetical protein [Nocardia wallacei]
MIGDGEVRRLPGADHAIRQLHSEIERLAVLASQAYISRTPLRVEQRGRDEIAYWYDDLGLKILTAGGTVHMSTALSFQDWPDWNALRNSDARALANALWSAAAYVGETHQNEEGTDQ